MRSRRPAKNDADQQGADSQRELCEFLVLRQLFGINFALDAITSG